MNGDEIDAQEAKLYDEKRQLIHRNNQLLNLVAANDVRITAIRIELGHLAQQRKDNMAADGQSVEVRTE